MLYSLETKSLCLYTHQLSSIVTLAYYLDSVYRLVYVAFDIDMYHYIHIYSYAFSIEGCILLERQSVWACHARTIEPPKTIQRNRGQEHINPARRFWHINVKNKWTNEPHASSSGCVADLLEPF